MIIEKIMRAIFDEHAADIETIDYFTSLVSEIREFTFEEFTILKTCHINPLKKSEQVDTQTLTKFLDLNLIVEYATASSGYLFGVTQKGVRALTLLNMAYPTQPYPDKPFSERLKETRLSARLSQKELAVACGVSAPSITYYEQGTTVPKIGVIRKLAEVLSVDPQWLELGY